MQLNINNKKICSYEIRAQLFGRVVAQELYFLLIKTEQLSNNIKVINEHSFKKSRKLILVFHST